MLQALDAATVDTAIELAAAAHPVTQIDQEPQLHSIAEILESDDDKSQEMQSLKAFLRDLTHEQMAELVALTWLGRGDAGEQPADFPVLVSAARSGGESTEYLACKIPLAEYLRKGLSRLTSGQ